MITLSDLAVQKIKELSEEESIGHNQIRVKLVGGGCSGYQFDMFYEDIINPTDEITEQDGVKIIVDEVSYHYLENLKIEYEDGLMSSGFKFNSENIVSSCGCGKSVSF